MSTLFFTFHQPRYKPKGSTKLVFKPTCPVTTDKTSEELKPPEESKPPVEMEKMSVEEPEDFQEENESPEASSPSVPSYSVKPKKKIRFMYTNRQRAKLLEGYDACQSNREKQLFLEANKLPYNTLKSWKSKKNRKQILDDANNRKFSGKRKSSSGIANKTKLALKKKRKHCIKCIKREEQGGL